VHISRKNQKEALRMS